MSGVSPRQAEDRVSPRQAAIDHWVECYNGAADGSLPPHAPEPCLLFYLLAEYGVWAHETPLLSLPPQLGGEIIALLTRVVPYRAAHAKGAYDALMTLLSLRQG